MFREVVRVLHEYRFVHLDPPAMSKNRANFMIAKYEGVKVDWLVIIADSLRTAIQSVVDDKKVWTVVAQWLTLLALSVPTIKAKKQGRSTDATPNKPSKGQQLLAKHTPGWSKGGSEQEETNRK